MWTADGVAACEETANGQKGVIHRRQANGHGIGNRTIHHYVVGGKWRQIYTNTFVPRPVPITWETRLMAAVLEGGPGTVAAGKAVLRLLDFPAFADAGLEIAGTKHTRLPDVECHRYRNMRAEDVVTIAGIPSRRFEPTLLELCGNRMERYRCGALLDEALRMKLTHLRWLYRTLFDYGKRGRAGTRLFRTLLEQRDDQDALTDSELERLFKEMGSRLSILPVMHHVVRGSDDEHVAEVDFALPALQIAVELQGFDPHKHYTKFDLDNKRMVLLQNLGWVILTFTWWQVRHDADWVLEQIEIAIGRRHAQLWQEAASL